MPTEATTVILARRVRWILVRAMKAFPVRIEAGGCPASATGSACQRRQPSPRCSTACDGVRIFEGRGRGGYARRSSSRRSGAFGRPAQRARRPGRRVPARPQGSQDRRAPAAGNAGGDRRRQGHREPGNRDRPPRQGPRQVCRHGARAWRRPRRREDRGQLGRAQRRAPDRLQAGLGPPRTSRTVPPQRGAPEPAAEGRDRVPRLRHHREPRRQGTAARYSGWL